MPLLHEPHRRQNVRRHPQPRHHDAESAPGETRDADFSLDVAQFEGGGEDADVVEFAKQELFVLEADGVGGGEGGEGVG